jgi:short-subunit dehydrogenase
MLAQGGGAIVNTASIAGLVGLPTASNGVGYPERCRRFR